MEKVERITQRYTLEDARSSIKRIITRLLIHDNAPTSLYFIEILQHAKADYELRQHMKFLHKSYEEKQEKTLYETFVAELKKYSDEGLENLESSLLLEMEDISMSSPDHEELQAKYSALYDEFVRRNLRPDF
jgi:hypothetical protein